MIYAVEIKETMSRVIYVAAGSECEALAKADGLPNDFKELIEKNQYGLGKINI